MLKRIKRLIPETEFVDECEPAREEFIFLTRGASAAEYGEYYAQQLTIHYGAEEFKTTIKELENRHEE